MPRLAAAFALVSAWLMILLTGAAPAWVAYLFLGGAVVAFPWSQLRQTSGSSSDE